MAELLQHLVLRGRVLAFRQGVDRRLIVECLEDRLG